MSDYGYVVERARKAQAAVSRLEQALARNPQDASLRVNLAAHIKLARRAEEQFEKLAATNQIEVCNYRLVPATAESDFRLPFVAKSMLNYQSLFSQIHDALRNGPKRNAVIGAEALAESTLEFGYSYSGSLGVVLLVEGERGFFEGGLDRSIEALFDVVDIQNQDDVRDVARSLGQAVVKRVYDWSESNVEGGFDADVRWRRSDGHHLGQIVERRKMEAMIEIIDATSDVETDDQLVDGVLVGMDVVGGTFHFIVPDGDDFRGGLSPDFERHGPIVLNASYRALIVESRTTKYATEKVEKKFSLKRLDRREYTPPLPSG